MGAKEENPKVSFQQKVLNAFDEFAKMKEFSKGDFILRAGEVERHIYLIEKGAVRLYFESEEEEIVIRLGYKSSILNSLTSFIRHTPSDIYIQAIRKTTIKQISYSNFQNILENDPEGPTQYAQFLEQILIDQIERERDLLTASPAKRLERVLKRSPHLFQYVPLKYIASYLRMKPETLSRIRKS